MGTTYPPPLYTYISNSIVVNFKIVVNIEIDSVKTTLTTNNTEYYKYERKILTYC